MDFNVISATGLRTHNQILFSLITSGKAHRENALGMRIAKRSGDGASKSLTKSVEKLRKKKINSELIKYVQKGCARA